MLFRIPRNLLAVCLVGLFSTSLTAQIDDFSADFEGVDAMSETAISDLGYVVFGNVFDSEFNFCYGYGPEPAPNSTVDGVPDAFSGIVVDAGSGANSLNIFSDYQNGDHNNGKIIQANVFREVQPVAADVGRMITYEFDFRQADDPNGPSGATETFAFIRVIDQFNNFALVDEFRFETTNATNSFQTGSISVEIIPEYFNNTENEGLLFQYGFFSFASNNEASGIYYDNISVGEASDCLIGDVNGDGAIDLLDVQPFVLVLTSGNFQCEADINEDGAVDLLDVQPFVLLLSGG